MRRLLAIVFLLAAAALAQSTPASGPEAVADAWFTGSMLAPSAGVLPRGHWLVEPYFFDIAGSGYHTAGSLSYIVYGATNRLSVGAIPVIYFDVPGSAPDSPLRPHLGDFSLEAQYGLTTFHPGHRLPTLAINVQELFPTGRYDRLDGAPSAGFGSGAYATTLGLYSQDYFWLPNGRILRARANFTETFSGIARVNGQSVYATPADFQGSARPGDSSYLDLAGEYSLTERWVGALDLTYRHTAVTGIVPAQGSPSWLASSDSFALAPAAEYNFNSRLGILVGLRVIPQSHNTSASLTPVLAINIVR